LRYLKPMLPPMLLVYPQYTHRWREPNGSRFGSHQWN